MQVITFLVAERPSGKVDPCWGELQRLIVLVAECEHPAGTVIASGIDPDHVDSAVDRSVIVYGIDPDHVDSGVDTGVFEIIIPSARLGGILKLIVDGQPSLDSVDVTPTMPPTQGPKLRAALDYAASLRIDEKLAQVGALRITGARGLESPSSEAVQPLVQGATRGLIRLVAALSVVRVDHGSGQPGRRVPPGSRRLIVGISETGIGHALVACAIDPVGADGGDVVFEHGMRRADLGTFIEDMIDGHEAPRARNAGASTATPGELGLDEATDIPGRSSRDAVRRVVLALAASIDSDQRLADAVASGEPDRMASNAP
jgi:hypothetical protein